MGTQCWAPFLSKPFCPGPHASASTDVEGPQDTWLKHSVFSVSETHGLGASSQLGLGKKMQSCSVLGH